MKNWKVGDWVIFDMDIFQIKRIDDYVEVSDGFFNTSGSLLDRLRPLTLINKRISEKFKYWYKQLDEIDGNAGFNYPDIHRYFSQLTLDAIDSIERTKDNAAANGYFESAQEFVKDAGDYKKTIQGISLFRKK